MSARSDGAGAVAQPLYIELLGPPTFRVGDAPYGFKALPLCLPLLAYFVINRRSTMQREALAAVFWPDDDDDEARGKLRRHLHRLQAALPPSSEPWIVGDTRQLRWNAAAPAIVDVDVFEAYSARGADPEAAIPLYRGEFLEGRYEEWVFPHRERLRGLQIDNYTYAIAQRRSAGEYERAIALAKSLLALDPWREPTIRTLMALRYARGDRAGALAEYEVFAQRLHADLDTTPMPETVAAYEDIVRRAGVEQHAWAGAADSTPAQPHVLPFAGRVRETQIAEDAFARAVSGEGRGLFVSGEAGVGKSRFLREMAARFDGRGATVLIGSTAAPETSPYQAIIETLRSALPILQSLDGVRPSLAALGTLLPELRDVTSPDDVTMLDPARRRAQLFEAVALAFERLAAARPIVLAFEDVHWAGDATAELLEYVVRRLARHRVLVVATYRAEEVGRAHPLRARRRTLEREALATGLPLSRLAHEDVRCIVRARGGDDDLADALYQRSEGNGFFLSEVLRGRVEGVVTTGDLNATLHANLARLDDAARAFAQTAAVAGASFDLELVLEICKWPEHEGLASLDALLDAGIVRESSGVRRHDYRFSHNLLQAFVYDAIPPARRRREHLRAAAAIPDLYATHLEERHGEIALHYERGGDGPRAAPHFLAAAERALAVFANGEAVTYAASAAAHAAEPAVRFRALSIAEEGHRRRGERAAQSTVLDAMDAEARAERDADGERETLRRRIALHHAIGDRAQEAETIARLRELARDAEPRWAGEAAAAEALLRWRNGELEAGASAGRDAVRRFRESGESRRALLSVGVLAEIEAAGARFAEARAHVEEGRALAAELRDRAALGPLVNSAGVVEVLARNFSAARGLAAEALELCVQTGDREGEADANARLAMLAVRSRDYPAAARHYDDAEHLYEALGKRLGLAIVALNRGCLSYVRADVEESLASWRAGAERFAVLGDLRGQALCFSNASWALLTLGRLDEGLSAAREADAHAVTLASPVVRAQTLAMTGGLEFQLGRRAAGIARMEEGLALRPPGAPEVAEDLITLSLAYLAVGRLEDAVAAAIRMESASDGFVADMWWPQDLWWACSRVRLAAGDLAGHAVYVDRARAAFDRRAAEIGDPKRAATYAGYRFNPEIIAATS